MIKNVGHKLQVMGSVVLWGGVAISAIAFTVLELYLGSIRDYGYLYEEEISLFSTVAALVFFLGPFLSILFGLLINGFGTLIENTMPETPLVDLLTKPKD